MTRAGLYRVSAVNNNEGARYAGGSEESASCWHQSSSAEAIELPVGRLVRFAEMLCNRTVSWMSAVSVARTEWPSDATARL